MGAMAVRSVLLGIRCSQWTSLIKVQAKRTRERLGWCLVWRRRSIFRLREHGRRTSIFLRMILRVLCVLQGVAESLQTITVILFASKWSCLLSRIGLQDAFGEVMKVCPSFEAEDFRERYYSFLGRTTPGAARHCREGLEGHGDGCRTRRFEAGDHGRR